MERNRKLELINLAIQSLAEEKKNRFPENKDDDAEYRLALSRLLSELEKLKGDGALELERTEASSPPETVASAVKEKENKNVEVGEADGGCMGNDAIVKELKKVKRQNVVTHCLLSVMIVLTLAWQLSEASLVMKVRDGLNHPFKAVGSMITGMIKDKVPDNNGQAAEDKEHQPEPTLLP